MLQMMGVCKGKRKFASFMKKIKLYLLVQLNFKTENKMSKGLRTGLSTALSTKLSTRLSTKLSTSWVQGWVQSWVQGWVQGLATAVFKVVPSVQLVRFTGWQTALCFTSPLFSPSPLVLPEQFLLHLLISLPLLPLFFSNSLHTFPYILPVVYFSSLVSLSSESPLVWHFSRLRGRESATPP